MTLLLEESVKKFGGQLLFVSSIWKERNKTSFENVELSIQRLKFLFLCSLLSWTNLFIENTTMSLVDFIDWLGSD